MTFEIMNAACPTASTIADIIKLSEQDPRPIVTKTCTLHPIDQKGTSWYHYTPSGTVNRIRLVNPGYNYFRSIQLLRPGQKYIISIAGTLEEIKKILSLPTTADMFEVNISCPNHSLTSESRVVDNIYLLSRELHWPRPYGIKLPPCLTVAEITRISDCLQRISSKKDLQLPAYVVCCNTLPNGIVDGKLGALSGPPLKPIALFNVFVFRRLLSGSIKVYGCGGISSKKDIEEFKKEGADGVQIGSHLLAPILRAKL